MNYTYIVECADHTLYTGWTNRLSERLAAHNSGRGAKYTKTRRPVTLAYYETFDTKEEALRRERALKKMTRAQKLRLIESMDKNLLSAFTDPKPESSTDP